MKSISLVFADFGYDGQVPIKGFASRFVAQEFVTTLYLYHEKKQPCPGAEDTAENDAAWEKWQKKNDRWRKKHPGGETGASAEGFNIQDIPFVEG